MAAKDLAIRMLAQHVLADFIPALSPEHDVVVQRVEEPKVKLVERLTDCVAFIVLDGEPALLHVEFEASFSVPSALTQSC